MGQCWTRWGGGGHTDAGGVLVGAGMLGRALYNKQQKNKL